MGDQLSFSDINQDLVRVHSDSGKDTVNARDIHVFLESKQRFSDWFTNRVTTYGFEKDKDFIIIPCKSSGGRPSREFHVSIDMAKELGMVERNEKGREIRQWFIDRENDLRTKEIQTPKTFAEALQLAADQARMIEQQHLQIAEDKPKVEFYEVVREATGLHTVAEAAKLLGTGRNRLYKILRDNAILRSNNEPYQSFINHGYFVVKEIPYETLEGKRINAQTFVTPKGLQWIEKKKYVGPAL